MKRYSGQRALYEAMKRSGSRRKSVGLLERLTPQLEKVGRLAKSVVEYRPKLKIRQRESTSEKPAPAVLKPPRPVERHESPVKASPTQTWLRPKAVQFNAGRIEISLPWQLGVVIGLLVIVAVLVIYRLGQIDQRARYQPNETLRPDAAVESIRPQGSRQTPATTDSTETPRGQENAAQNDTAVSAIGGKSDHVIVLAQFPKREDLEPVQAFFEKHGISTTIHSFATLRTYFETKEYLNAKVVPKGEGFMLASGLVENPETSGTNGYELKQKIIELGAQYKAPKGLESFARHHFSDAYGMKVK